MIRFLEQWQIALSGGMVVGVLFGVIEGFSIFSSAFVHDLRISHVAAATVFAAYLLSSTAIAPIAGKVVDRIGARKAIVTAFPIFAVTVALCSAVDAIWQFYILYVAFASTTANTLMIACQTLVGNAYDKRRGRALGIMYGCLGLGDFVMFSILGIVVQEWGWRRGYLFAAAVAALGAMVFTVLVHRVHGWSRGKIYTEDQASGDAPPGRRDIKFADRPVSDEARHLSEIHQVPRNALLDAEISNDSWRRVPARKAHHGSVRLAALVLAAIAASVLDFVVFQQLVPFLVRSGRSESLAGFVLGLAALGYTAGQVGGGWLSDRQGREPVAIASAFLFVGSAALVYALPALPVLMAAVVGLGASVGGAIGARSAATADIFAGPSLGMSNGIVGGGSSIGAAFGTWFGAFDVDTTGTYALTFLIAAAFACLWAVCLVLAAPRRGGLNAGTQQEQTV